MQPRFVKWASKSTFVTEGRVYHAHCFPSVDGRKLTAKEWKKDADVNEIQQERPFPIVTGVALSDPQILPRASAANWHLQQNTGGGLKQGPWPQVVLKLALNDPFVEDQAGPSHTLICIVPFIKESGSVLQLRLLTWRSCIGEKGITAGVSKQWNKRLSVFNDFSGYRDSLHYKWENCAVTKH